MACRHAEALERRLTPFVEQMMALSRIPGMAIMQLVAAGLVALDDPIVQHLPYFAMADERTGQITIRQMLSHTSGMPDGGDSGCDRPEVDDGALERCVRSVADRPLVAAPGERFAYSNLAYEVLGDLIVKVRGVTFEAQIDQHVLRPLGMTNRTVLQREANSELFSRGHVLDANSEVIASPVERD